ncbi:MAG: PqqD family protein [Polyangiaceae bacterium]|nr:PqqD family protein [Polyangiaceae bacterium]
MSSVSPAARVFRVRDDVAIEGFDDGGLVLRLSDRQFVELDPVALFIVQVTDGTRSVGEVAAMVSAHFEGADGDVERDVLDLYGSLVASRVVDETPIGPGRHGE